MIDDSRRGRGNDTNDAHGDTDKGPYSTTVVKSDAEDEKTHQATSQPIVAYVLGGAALLVSLYAVIRRRK